jgi:hypothetical protein
VVDRSDDASECSVQPAGPGRARSPLSTPRANACREPALLHGPLTRVGEVVTPTVHHA